MLSLEPFYLGCLLTYMVCGAITAGHVILEIASKRHIVREKTDGAPWAVGLAYVVAFIGSFLMWPSRLIGMRRIDVVEVEGFIDELSYTVLKAERDNAYELLSMLIDKRTTGEYLRENGVEVRCFVAKENWLRYRFLCGHVLGLYRPHSESSQQEVSR